MTMRGLLHKPPKSKRSNSSNLNTNMLRHRNDDVMQKYEIVRKIGEGSMGSISKAKIRDDRIGGSAYKSRRARLCGCFGFILKSRKYLTSDPTSMREGRRDGEIYYALKTIVMSRISPAFIDELRNEIDILKGLDHPNIVKAFEVFESKQQIFIVMELCAGGDLYRHLPYSEKNAASITAKICSAIAYMHGKDVVHRDLKFENIMFETAEPDSEIKIIDFGLSKKFRPGDHNKTMTEGVGTIYTMAPQVIRGTAYTSKADLWSLGVITFMLLASQKPFKGKKRRQVVDHIMRCDYSFESEIWRTLSAESKDFIRHLLVIDPDERMDAKTALKHRWLSKEYKLSDRRPDEELMRKVEDSLLAYKYTSALKKVALNVIARKSTPREIFQLRKAFGQYDIENDGTISFEEFKEALKQSNYSDKELAEIFNSIEVNAIGHIMYTGKVIVHRSPIDFSTLKSNFTSPSKQSSLLPPSKLKVVWKKSALLTRSIDLTMTNLVIYHHKIYASCLWDTPRRRSRH